MQYSDSMLHALNMIHGQMVWDWSIKININEVTHIVSKQILHLYQYILIYFIFPQLYIKVRYNLSSIILWKISYLHIVKIPTK